MSATIGIRAKYTLYEVYVRKLFATRGDKLATADKTQRFKSSDIDD